MNSIRTYSGSKLRTARNVFSEGVSTDRQTNERDWGSSEQRPDQSEAEQPTLLLDVNGYIRFCNAAARALFCRDGESLVGRAISAVLPALKLTDATPGYNVAYVAFWYPEGRWHAILGIDSHGDPVALEIALHELRLRDGHTFVATFRRI